MRQIRQIAQEALFAAPEGGTYRLPSFVLTGYLAITRCNQPIPRSIRGYAAGILHPQTPPSNLFLDPSLFQILQSTGAGISKFIAVIEVAVAEFMAGEDGATLSKSFQKPGQTAPCWLTMKCHYEKATFAGGGGEEEELDSDAD